VKQNPIDEYRNISSKYKRLLYISTTCSLITIGALTYSTTHPKDVKTPLVNEIIKLQQENSKLQKEIVDKNATIEGLKKLIAVTSPVPSNLTYSKTSFKSKIAEATKSSNSKILLERDIMLNRQRYKGLVSNEELNNICSRISKKYGISSREDIHEKLQPIPVKLSVAQATLESGTGTSKYFKTANNAYGIYTFKGRKRNIEKFPSIEACVDRYATVLNSSKSLKKFRVARAKGENLFSLADTLNNTYCESNTYSTQLKAFLH
jgi:Bax protein